MSIGSQLREAREAKSISLDQVAQATHIRMHYLEALEADSFEVLPSATQLRGFLRIYADYLSLDSAELLAALGKDTDQDSVILAGPSPVNASPQKSASSDAIFKEIGDKLRSQRELMGLSLEDVERHSHIRLHYLRALEEGDIAHLPSPVQGRGMLSNYAVFLGLETESILLRFADGLQARLQDNQVERNGSAPRRRKKVSHQVTGKPSQLKRLFSMDLLIGGFLIFFLLGFSVWGALRISKLHSGETPSPTAPPVSEILLSSPAAALTGTAELTPGITGVATSENIVDTPIFTDTTEFDLTATPVVFEPTPPIANAPVQVYVIAHEQAWMRIIVDGDIAFEGRVVPGSAYSYAGNQRIDLLTGNAAGLQVYFNQQDLGILGGFGEVVERFFTIEGVQTATPAVRPTQTPVPTGSITPTPTTSSTALPNTPTATPRP